MGQGTYNTEVFAWCGEPTELSWEMNTSSFYLSLGLVHWNGLAVSFKWELGQICVDFWLNVQVGLGRLNKGIVKSFVSITWTENFVLESRV